MKVGLHTLGCKLNQAETSVIGSRFAARGFELTHLQDDADVVFINSCTVTETAEKECRRLVRGALRRNPAAFVIVTGCYAQLRPEEVASIDGVDLVLGSVEKRRAVELAHDFRKRDTPYVEVSNLRHDNGFGVGYTGVEEGRTKAFLKVQDGCDYSCSFCTIPLARGPSRSQALDESVTLATKLVNQGFSEIVLTGVNVGDYQKKEGGSLYLLLQKLHEIEGLKRLKLSSIEPNLLTDDIIALAARSDRLMPHFHVPLQSGSEEVLRRMRRRYRPAYYAERVRTLVNALPDCAVGVDVIVGFPGETKAEFQETVDFLCDLPIAYLHVFSYSERRHTPAATMENPVPRDERRLRTTVLRTLSNTMWTHFAQRFVGTERNVLFEQPTESGLLTGLTDNYIRVDVQADPNLSGTVQRVRIGEFYDGRAAGILVGQPKAPISKSW